MTSEGLFSTQDFMEGQKISEILSRINESQMAHHPQSYTIYWAVILSRALYMTLHKKLGFYNLTSCNSIWWIN